MGESIKTKLKETLPADVNWLAWTQHMVEQWTIMSMVLDMEINY
jgi:hypothetical protein